MLKVDFYWIALWSTLLCCVLWYRSFSESEFTTHLTNEQKKVSAKEDFNRQIFMECLILLWIDNLIHLTKKAKSAIFLRHRFHFTQAAHQNRSTDLFLSSVTTVAATATRNTLKHISNKNWTTFMAFKLKRNKIVSNE